MSCSGCSILDVNRLVSLDGEVYRQVRAAFYDLNGHRVGYVTKDGELKSLLGHRHIGMESELRILNQ